MHNSILVVLISFLMFFAVNSETISDIKEKATLSKNYQYLRRIYRDTNNPQYTQGLTFLDDETLLESSGRYRQSSIHYMNLNDVNTFQHNQKLDDKVFGEGCTIINDKVYQLTYLERKILVYEKDDLQYIGEIPMDPKMHEGWGLSHRYFEGELQILMTDSGHKIFIANENFQIVGFVPIFENYRGVESINELEYANGLLYANQLNSPFIFVIDLEKRKVVTRYDFTELVAEADRPYGPMNGIAYNKKTDTFWLTGKDWPFFQEVKFL